MYADSTAVLGPLATYAEPHSYDLCAPHAEKLTVPLGWEVVRLALPSGPPEPNPDDLLALANAVREAAVDRSAPEPAPTHGTSKAPLTPPPGEASARRSHLRVLRDL